MPMPRDTIFMLAPGFEDNNRREFCPECAELFGILSYYPAIRDAVEIVHVGIDHPRGRLLTCSVMAILMRQHW